MGKRGPKPQTPYEGPRKTISTKITGALRASLEQSAAESGRTLSAEIEHRLRRSFDEDKGIIERLGGRQLYAILRLVSASMDAAGVQSVFFNRDTRMRENAAWLNDPFAYDQAVKATIRVLEELRPPGKPIPSAGGPEFPYGECEADKFLDRVEFTPPGLPMPDDSDDEETRIARRIKSDLEGLSENLKARTEERGSRRVKVVITVSDSAVDKEHDQ